MPRFYAPLDQELWNLPHHEWQPWDVSLRQDLLDTNRVRLHLARWTRLMDSELEGVIVDTPWGDMIVTPCKHPDSEGARWDLPTAMWCRQHNRSIYYCDELRRLWCDGGPPDYAHHVFVLTPLAHK